GTDSSPHSSQSIFSIDSFKRSRAVEDNHVHPPPPRPFAEAEAATFLNLSANNNNSNHSNELGRVIKTSQPYAGSYDRMPDFRRPLPSADVTANRNESPPSSLILRAAPSCRRKQGYESDNSYYAED